MSFNWFTFVEISTKIAEFVIVFIFLREFLGPKPNRLYLVVACVILYISLLFFVTYVLQPGTAIVNILIVFLMVFSLSSLFERNIKLKIFATICVIVLFVVADLMTYFGIVLLSNIDGETILGSYLFNIFGAIISKFVFFLLVKAACRWRNQDNTNIPFKYWLPLLILPAISGVAIFAVFELGYRVCLIGIKHIVFGTSIGLLFANIITFQLFESALEKEALQSNEQMLSHQFDNQVANYSMVKSGYDANRSIVHDFHKHMDAIYGMAKNGENDDLLKYINENSELNAAMEERVYTGDSVIDAIFNSRITYAENIGINVITDEVNVPEDLPIDLPDKCVIFGNAWDNAIESCTQILEGEKFIKVVLKYYERKLVFHLVNSTVEKTRKRRMFGREYFKSLKPKPREQSFGIINIEKSVAKYGGVFTTKQNTEENTFEITAVIYCI